MKRVRWSSDVISRYRCRGPPITSIGSFIVYLLNAQFKNIPTETACLNALRTYTARNRNIFTAAEFAIPYCVDERLHHVKICLTAITSPLSNPNAYDDIAQMETVTELVDYVEKYRRLTDRTVVYRWILAFTRPRHELIRYIIQNTQPQTRGSSHVLQPSRNCRGTFREKKAGQQERAHR